MHPVIRNALSASPLILFAIWFNFAAKPVPLIFVVSGAIAAVCAGVAIYRATRARGAQS